MPVDEQFRKHLEELIGRRASKHAPTNPSTTPKLKAKPAAKIKPNAAAVDQPVVDEPVVPSTVSIDKELFEELVHSYVDKRLEAMHSDMRSYVNSLQESRHEYKARVMRRRSNGELTEKIVPLHLKRKTDVLIGYIFDVRI